MYPSLKEKLNQWRQRGFLSIAALLLTELLAVLWFAFFALFMLETLLPTFVTVRISLTGYLAFLIIGTLATLRLRQEGQVSSLTLSMTWYRPLLWSAALIATILLALSMARFPLLIGTIFFFGYGALGWLLWQGYQQHEQG